MNVLIAGDWHSELHEEAVYQALIKLGHQPSRFSWHQYFKSSGLWGKLGVLFSKAQNKYMLGPLVDTLNNDLLATVAANQPDLVFVYRGTHIYLDTLKKMRNLVPDAVLVGYNNDDPFSPYYPKWKWRHFLASVPEYDLVLAYRRHNLKEYQQAGANRVELLRSWFIPERNYPVELSDEERKQYECDVVFIGHYENDGRLEYLEEIVKQGFKLNIYGPGYEWDSVIGRSEALRKFAPVNLVWGEDYNRALCGAKVALCFFSKLNRDTYTRRCFEIPASGTLLMSKYSTDLATMFLPDKEAVYFNSIEEMNNKLSFLFENKKQMDEITAAGTHRVWSDKHDVVSRMSEVIQWVNDINRSAS